ncbi:MAG TPA: M20/M25/M40 family metallo-hydrolase [Kofleriaceae bacterium]|nr:M20/M25/M40 family metallo-hydrolase [Kofleriaceae bacterium]
MRWPLVLALALASPVLVTPARADHKAGGPAAPTSTAPTAPARAPSAPTTRAPDSSARAPAREPDASPYAPAALKAQVAAIADPALDGRASGSTGDTAGRALIRARLDALGLSPTEQAFDDDAGHATANILATLPGSDPDAGIVIVGAHHDHLGGKHLGANDNASGVAAMLAIADALHGTQPKRTIVFAAWGAEERGEEGSAYFVKHPTVELARVVEYVNLDMVGSYSSRGFVAAMGTFRRLPATAMLAAARRAFPKLSVGIGGRAERSDHEAFCEHGVPYVFFWTPDARCYHETCDTPDKLDTAHMAQIAALAGDLVERLANSKLDLRASRAKLGCFGR